MVHTNARHSSQQDSTYLRKQLEKDSQERFEGKNSIQSRLGEGPGYFSGSGLFQADE